MGILSGTSKAGFQVFSGESVDIDGRKVKVDICKL